MAGTIATSEPLDRRHRRQRPHRGLVRAAGHRRPRRAPLLGRWSPPEYLRDDGEDVISSTSSKATAPRRPSPPSPGDDLAGPDASGECCGGGPHDRDIYRLALPALGALIAEPLYVLADTAVVGHLGTDELAGLAIANAVLATGFAVFIFLAYGTTSAVARLIGAGDDRRGRPPGRAGPVAGRRPRRRPRRVLARCRRAADPPARRRGRGGRQRPGLPADQPPRPARPPSSPWPAPATCGASRTPAPRCWWPSAPRWSTWSSSSS